MHAANLTELNGIAKNSFVTLTFIYCQQIQRHRASERKPIVDRARQKRMRWHPKKRKNSKNQEWNLFIGLSPPLSAHFVAGSIIVVPIVNVITEWNAYERVRATRSEHCEVQSNQRIHQTWEAERQREAERERAAMTCTDSRRHQIVVVEKYITSPRNTNFQRTNEWSQRTDSKRAARMNAFEEKRISWCIGDAADVVLGRPDRMGRRNDVSAAWHAAVSLPNYKELQFGCVSIARGRIGVDRRCVVTAVCKQTGDETTSIQSVLNNWTERLQIVWNVFHVHILHHQPVCSRYIFIHLCTTNVKPNRMFNEEYESFLCRVMFIDFY